MHYFSKTDFDFENLDTEKIEIESTHHKDFLL